MVDFQATIKRLAKDKKIVVPAIIGGGALGLYVLSKKGGSLSAASTVTPTDPNAAGAGGGGSAGNTDGSTSSDVAGLANQLAQQQAGQGSFQASITKALSDLAAQFSSALGKQQSDTQSALNSLAGQTNQALSGLASQGQNQPDLSGFENQFAQALQGLEAQVSRAASTGAVQQFQIPSAVPLNFNSPTPTYANIPAPVSIFSNISQGLGNALNTLRSTVPAPNPPNLGGDLAHGSFGLGSFDLGSLSGYVKQGSPFTPAPQSLGSTPTHSPSPGIGGGLSFSSNPFAGAVATVRGYVK